MRKIIETTTPPLRWALGRRRLSRPLAVGAGRVRLIAGEFGGYRGPAETFMPMQVLDLRLSAAVLAALSGMTFVMFYIVPVHLPFYLASIGLTDSSVTAQAVA